MADNKAKAAEAKALANKAFSAGQFDEAAQHFSAAIELDPTDHVFYSNRSACYASLQQFDKALVDAQKCVELKGDWAKGYSRVGAAQLGLQNLKEAEAAYKQAVALDAANAQYKESLQDVERQIADASNPMKAMFGPQMWIRLQQDATTREYLKDPAFVNQLKMLAANPNAMGSLLQNPDRRLSQALGVILGMGANFAAAGGEDVEMGKAQSGADVMVESDDEDATQKASPAAAPKPAPKPAAAPAPEPELSPEEQAEADKKKKATALKDQANALYAKRQFDEAVALYQQALEVDPTLATALGNIAAVKLEQKEYDACVDYCTQALDVGRTHRTIDYKAIAKLYLRIANAYVKKGDLDQAKVAVGKSLVEHYDQPAKKLQKEIEAAIKQRDELAYLSEEKSEEAKAKGNEAFTAQKWPEAITHFTEAIKRNPKNYKVLGNRAATYMKLCEWGLALDDANKAIAIEPKFVKGYVRKANAQKMLKQYKQAMDTIATGMEIEPENAELIECRSTITRLIREANASGEADPQRAQEAMKDPEIRAIMADPAINQIIQELSQPGGDKKRAMEALKDPAVANKLNKLMEAGILRTG